MITTLHEEYRAEVCDAMGEELGSLYIQLLEELFTLHMKWITFSQFFRVNEERVKTLNDALSGSIAVIIEDALLDSTLLSVSYLGDTNRKAFKLEKFKNPLEVNEVDKEIQEELDDLIVLTRETSKDLRNNHIAHHNYALYISKDRDFQYPLSETIDEILDKSQKFANDLALWYGIPPFNIYYPTYEGKVSKFFYLLSGDMTKDDKFGLKRMNRSKEELEHLRSVLDRFKPDQVYSLIDEEILRNGISD